MGNEREFYAHSGFLSDENHHRLCASLLETVRLFEKVQRKFHPVMIRKHGEKLAEKVAGLQDALDELLPESTESIQEGHSPCPGEPCFSADTRESRTRCILKSSAFIVLEAISKFNASVEMQAGIINAMQAGRKICRAKEMLFELRRDIRDIDDFFRENAMVCRPGMNETQDCPGRGERLVHGAGDQEPYARGAPSFYMPEMRENMKRLPVVVTLHGGFGHGRDFIWTWIREARSRSFFLLAPTSAGITWSLENPEIDLLPLTDLLQKLAGEYPLNLQRVLLTGFSDGASFALRCALKPRTPFHAFGPVSGVLLPIDLSFVRSRRIFWVHGAHDWMFPVARARSGRESLEKAGAAVDLKILEDLAHAYPSEENASMLAWFDPMLFPAGSARGEQPPVS